MRVSTTDIQNNFGKYLLFAEAGEEIIVALNGKDIAAVIAIMPDLVKRSACMMRCAQKERCSCKRD